MTPEQSKQFNEIFDELGKSLDITRTQYDAAVASYQFVGDWLSRPESPLAPYKPEILPQGSFLHGTMVKPIHEDDDIDVDLVCRLLGKKSTWSQADLKKIVGDRLKAHETLKRMLEKEGRRCWTLAHREEARFHMDVLPAIISSGFMELLEKSMTYAEMEKAAELAIRITDNLTINYLTSSNPEEWLKSNPFGYAAWFNSKASLDFKKAIVLNEAVQPVPNYQQQKLPLQRIVQIYKRHRDIMFNGDEDKPISIIITTLAARAYQGQTDVFVAILAVAEAMANYIEERYDPKLKRMVKWISNPVNPEENFADKWPASPQKQQNFYKWLSQLRADLSNIVGQRGLYNIQEALANPFGRKTVNTTFSNIGERARQQRESGAMKMASGTGILGTIGRTSVPNHTNFGSNE
jgi:hypothetical protein